MTLFKKILLFIIAIQVMVLIQIASIKKWNLNENFQHLTSNFNFDFDFSDSNPKLSPEEYAFFSTLSESVEVELEKYDTNLLQNQLFTLGQGHIRKAIKDDVESTAKELLGTPYVWGATGPNKFDCSGFTQEVFCQAGIHIPRNSRAQAKVGKYVPLKHLKRGDMVFFATNKRNPNRITHVGIYLYNGKFIHASSGGKRVIISSLVKSNYYKNNFVLGRRIIRGHKTKEVAQVLSYNQEEKKIANL
ncbi:MAG: Invasion associated protein p60 [uncultured Sulfurovum sp.]|uniref:Invasion associated protein p60 n=1 Tax=uncultured Sulfurovum sp. TaxID=269237 RepID=A0A6S6TTT5_9BACT|nr:MAG: Invasion associated protein p60 [uncultured Sulfurovum sp.]